MAESIPAGARLTSAARRAQYRHVGEARGGVGEADLPPCSVDESAGERRGNACPRCHRHLVVDAEGVLYCEANPDHYRSDVVGESAGGSLHLRPLAYPVRSFFALEGEPDIVAFTFAGGTIASAYDHRRCAKPCPEDCIGEYWMGGGTATLLDPIGPIDDQRADDAREIRRILEDA